MRYRSLTLLAALVCAACAADTPEPRVAIDLAAVYERTDRDFESAVMFRPDDAAMELAGFTLAPMIVIENGEAGRDAPVVLYTRHADGWTYRWTDPLTGRDQGIHLTLGDDGFPLAVEILSDSSGARLLFVEMSLELAAAKSFGSPLADRRWSIERSREETPAVVVGGIFEPGTMPLGPFVYLWDKTHDVNVVLCRCMAPRVFDIVDSIPYTLKPAEEAGFEALKLASALRLASEGG